MADQNFSNAKNEGFYFIAPYQDHVEVWNLMEQFISDRALEDSVHMI